MITGLSATVRVHVKADVSQALVEATGESRSLVLKTLQSSVRPEVLEELMDADEGVSEMPWIIKYDQVSRALVQIQMPRHTGAGPWFLLHSGKKTNTCNPYKV